jgi:hypothetical protein
MRSKCPESTSEHSPLDAYGRCSWCHQIVGSRQPKPSLHFWVSELCLAYDYYYNPDYGTTPNGPYYNP